LRAFDPCPYSFASAGDEPPLRGGNVAWCTSNLLQLKECGTAFRRRLAI